MRTINADVNQEVVDDFIVQASIVKEPLVFDIEKWNVKRERLEVASPRCAESKKKKPTLRKLSKQQNEFCKNLIRVLIAAENNGDIVDSRDIVQSNFSHKCSDSFVDMLNLWRQLQPNIVRTHDRVKFNGNEIIFTTVNSGSCDFDGIRSICEELRLIDSASLWATSMEDGKRYSENFYVVSTESHFHLHLNMTSNKIESWTVEHNVTDVEEFKPVTQLSMAPSTVSLESFPLLFCNGCNSDDIVFLRQLSAKYCDRDAVMHHCSEVMSLGTYETFLQKNKMNPAVPDHLHKLVTQRRSDNSITFKTIYTGTLLCPTSPLPPPDAPSVDALEGFLPESALCIVKISKLFEVVLHVDPASQIIVMIDVKELHSVTTPL